MQIERSLSERVTIEIADGVAEVTLNRPDKLNALDPAMFEAIIAAGERVSRTAGLRAIVLVGAGKGFCAGLDKETFASLVAKGAPALGELTKRTHGIANAFQQAAYVWRTLPVPVIAAIHGVALGGGFQIALGADVRYVAPDGASRYWKSNGALFPTWAESRLCANSPAPTSCACHRPASAPPSPTGSARA